MGMGQFPKRSKYRSWNFFSEKNPVLSELYSAVDCTVYLFPGILESVSEFIEKFLEIA